MTMMMMSSRMCLQHKQDEDRWFLLLAFSALCHTISHEHNDHNHGDNQNIFDEYKGSPRKAMKTNEFCQWFFCVQAKWKKYIPCDLLTNPRRTCCSSDFWSFYKMWHILKGLILGRTFLKGWFCRKIFWKGDFGAKYFERQILGRPCRPETWNLKLLRPTGLETWIPLIRG